MFNGIGKFAFGSALTVMVSMASALTVSSPEIYPMPLQPAVMNGVGEISFTISEDESVVVAYDENSSNQTLEVSLNKLKVSDIGNISGSVLDYFDISTNATGNKILLAQNNEIPANAVINVVVPVAVVGDAGYEETYDVGFEANILSEKPLSDKSAVELYTFTHEYDVSVVKIIQPQISPMPLAPVEEGGVGNASFEFSVHGDDMLLSSVFGQSNLQIGVSHTDWIELENYDVDNITGSLIEYFEAVYVNDVLYFNQTKDIPAFTELVVTWPITVVQNSNEAQSLNMFNANIAAIDRNIVSVGHASAATYTYEPSVDSEYKFSHIAWKEALFENNQKFAYTLANPFGSE